MQIYNRDYYVYIHTNKINGKMYVGLTKNLKQRWSRNGSRYIESKKFWNAICKYGWDNFDHEIFAANLTREQACNMQKLLIKELDTIQNGYNISEGGDCYCMSEQGRKIVAICAHERFAGVSFTDQHKQKISQTRTKYSGCVPGKTPVRCIQTQQEFESVSEAAKMLGVNHGQISAVLTGKRNHTHGLHFEYLYPLQKPNDYPEREQAQAS